MKLLFLIGVIVIFATGYLLGSFIPLSSFQGSAQMNALKAQVEGDTPLYVQILSDAGTPVANLEVDFGIRNADGGHELAMYNFTNQSGVATFFVKDGDYLIFFNTNGFPSNLAYMGALTSVTVTNATLNEKTITLKNI